MATITQAGTVQDILATEAIVSSDSHIMEPPDLWEKRLPAALADKLPKFGPRGGKNSGGGDPTLRVQEMATDGVSGEVLYHTLGLRLFAVEDRAAQEAAFQVGNDYMAEYCSAAPDRLWGIPMLSCYDIKAAVKELERTRKMGLIGGMIWQVPPEHLRFTGDHYEDLWAAAQDLDAPINLHILSGFNYSRFRSTDQSGMEAHRNSVNTKVHDAMTSIFDLVFSGVLERYPRLKFVLVENELGWLPFVVHQWDRYVKRFGEKRPIAISELPSFYVDRQVYCTFINDPPGAYLLSRFGTDNSMWSSDYPHDASTWPDSRQVITRDMEGLPVDVLRKVLRENVVRLYGLKEPARLS